MASSATTRNRFQKQGTGDNSNTWGVELNAALDRIDESLDGLEAFTLSGSKTLTSTNYVDDEARERILKITGGTGGAITIPAVEKWYFVRNAASGAVTVGVSGGTAASIASGSSAAVLCDATDCFVVINYDFGSTVPKSSGTPTTGSHLTNKTYVDAQAFSAALPAQTGNGDKYVTTDGSTASWATLQAGIEALSALSSATVAGADEIIVLDNDDSGTAKRVTAQSIADLADGGVSEVNGKTGAVTLDPDDLDDSATTNKFTTAGDISKLAAIEASADVTDETNVVSALDGATLTSVTPATDDEMLLQDTDDSGNLKTSTLSDILALAGSSDIQEFTSSGTWTKPSGLTIAIIELWGAGGGGGSGGRNATSSNRGGGGGGGGGAYQYRLMPLSALGSTETVTIAAGGAGGAAQTTNSTQGNDGSLAGQSTFGSILYADGGAQGGGGKIASSAAVGGSGASAITGLSSTGFGAAAAGANNAYGGGGGGAGAYSSAAGEGGDSLHGGAGGGGGGSINSGDLVQIPRDGGGQHDDATATGTAAANSDGAAGTAATFQGHGGGGGAREGGTGGAGYRGGGGGGGGGSTNGTASGAGGAGGDGYCRVICL